MQMDTGRRPGGFPQGIKVTQERGGCCGEVGAEETAGCCGEPIASPAHDTPQEACCGEQTTDDTESGGCCGEPRPGTDQDSVESGECCS